MNADAEVALVEPAPSAVAPPRRPPKKSAPKPDPKPARRTVPVSDAEMPGVVEAVLERAVRIATGRPDAAPREGQRALADDVLKAMTSRSHCAGEAPTGSGKSFAALAPAMVLAATRSERTVISTETIGLQSQILNKDAPVVAQATEDTLGRRPSFAVLKGWSNFACFGHNTEILTYEGVKRIGDLSGKTVRILDGSGHWTDADIVDFGVQQIVELTVIKVRGSWTIDTTADHRWFVKNNVDLPAREATTLDLNVGDRLAYVGPKNRCLGKMIPSTFGIAQGLMFGDGSRYASTDGGLHPGACNIQLHGSKKWPLAEFMNGAQVEPIRSREGYAEGILTVGGLPSFFKDRPSLGWNTSYLYGWLAGYFATDGAVSVEGSPSISSASRKNLEFVTEVCAHLGIDHGRISMLLRESRFTHGKKTPLFKLPIAARSLSPEFFLIKEHRRRFERRKHDYRREQARRRHTVGSVVVTDRFERVYCAVVPTTGSFALAGNILTGNCALSAVVTAQGFSETAPSDPADLAAHLKHSGEVEPEAKALLGWALREVATGGSGDRAAYPGTIEASEWQTVSTTTDECPGTKHCRYGDVCLPAKAREAAGEADIMVTNHAMLAIQAATGAPVVIGNQNLGDVAHLVVDEAHGLPTTVRNQGSVSIGAVRIYSVEHAVRRVTDTEGTSSRARALTARLDQAGPLAAHLEEELSRRSGGKVVAARDDSDLNEMLSQVAEWAGALKRLVPKPDKAGSPKGELALYRTHATLARFGADLAIASRERDDFARWVEPDASRSRGKRPAAVLKLAPVEVGGVLRANLYGTGAPSGGGADGGADGETGETGGETERPVVSVSAMSATLPSNFAIESGLSARRKEYPSPFAGAYQASLLYVPKPDPAVMAAPGGGGKQRFDVARHQDWAAERIVELVAANSGSALVLSATSAGGRRYAQALREASGGWVVHSQWDSAVLPRTVAEWREDAGSVLVGTRSLMTGVDAPGGTCSLVVIDRVPRAASNPVDDARLERVAGRLDLDRWGADRLVYVADAALLLEQAAGRLIRSVDDTGLVAVLDPRLIPRTHISYPEPTRKALLAGLARFPTRTSLMPKALGFLRDQGAPAAGAQVAMST